MIIDHVYDATTPYYEYPERSTYDQCVKFIDGEIEIALKDLKEEQFFETNDYGRLTKYCALALTFTYVSICRFSPVQWE